MPFNDKQVKQLLQPINPRRVLRDPRGNAHVSQQDITAHLNRMFGFGGWSKEVLDISLVYEEERTDKPGKWNVCYKALVRLTVKDPDGKYISQYDDGSMGVAQNQTRGDAHDLAYKSAVSLSTKRAAKDLGDQFGLSLYNKGQMTALVGATLVGLPDVVEDVEAHVEQQVSMGNDEVDSGPDPADVARDALREFACDKGLSLQAVADRFKADYGTDLRHGYADSVAAFQALLESGVVTL